jgi:hypothetical protein
MEDHIRVEPLPYKNRRRTFGLLLFIFIVAIPVLYLYATGYRFDFERPTNLVSTGGIYVAVEHAGTDVFIDNELARGSARTFRRAIYAQNLDVGTHRVNVQKDGYHTWVKELPVSKHLVTVVQAFNLPVVPQARVVSPWVTSTGTPFVATSSLLVASTTNEVVASTTLNIVDRERNTEFGILMQLFATSTSTSTDSVTDRMINQVDDFLEETSEATTTILLATTTIEGKEVKLFESGNDLYAEWIGSLENMPYYYCADEFEPYSTSTEESSFLPTKDLEAAIVSSEEFLHPVQTINDLGCEPVIQIHTQFKELKAFDFVPGSTDLVALLLDDGVYIIEIDNRAWQNVQPLVLGEGLDMRVENGNIYVYDGEIIYQMVLEYDE